MPGGGGARGQAAGPGGTALLQALAAEFPPPDQPTIEALLRPVGEHWIPMRMRPTISWSDLPSRRWDVGPRRGGAGEPAQAAALGAEPVLVDDNPPAEGPGGRPVLATGDGGLDALAACEVVVKSPGISRYRPEVAELAGRGIPLPAAWACGWPGRTATG